MPEHRKLSARGLEQMIRMGAAALGLLLVCAACSRQTEAPADGGKADRVFLNGAVYTANAGRDIASAVAIRGERILYVGDDEGARAQVGTTTLVEDLHGRMILPGFHDMHIHPMGIVEGEGCDIASRQLSLAQLAALVANCIAEQQPAEGEWLPVDQWNFSNGNQPVGELRTIRQALDRAAPNNPVILWGNDGHHGAVNSLALARAVNKAGVIVGISRETLATDFADYRDTIGVDASGEPNGELHETARELVQPPPWGSLAGLPEEVMPKVAERLAASGITSVQDAAAPIETLDLYQSLADKGLMTFNLSAALFQEVGHYEDANGEINIAAMVRDLEIARARYDVLPQIQANTVKVFVDGVMEGNPLNDPPTLPNAAVVNPYKQPRFRIDMAQARADIVGYVDTASETCQRVRDDFDAYNSPEAAASFRAEYGYHPAQCRISRGVLEHPRDFILEYMQAADAAGFKIHAHVIGDRATSVALDGFEALRNADGELRHRHSLGHLQLVAPEDYQRIGDLGLYLVFTYAWLAPDLLYDLTVNPFIDRLNGAQDLYRADNYYMTNAYPAAQLQALGAILAAGSDAPVDTRDPRPLYNIQQAVTRASGGHVLNAEGRVSLGAALDAYTIDGARLFGHEADTGSIEVGKYADLVIIDKDLLVLEAQGRSDEIADASVRMTLFRGQEVYRAH